MIDASRKRSMIFSGARWTGLSAVFSTLGALGQIALLARYLDAEAFGLYASIIAITTMITTLATSAFPDYLIVTKDDDGRVRSTLYFLCAGLALVLFFAFSAVSPFLSRWLHDGTTTFLLQIAGLQILIAGFSENLRAILRKRMIFRPVAIASFVGTAVGIVFSLTLIIYIRDARVLIYSWVLTNLVVGLLIFWSAWRNQLLPHMIFDRREIAPFWILGRWRLLAYLLNVFNSRFDVVLITWVLGPSAAGIYFVAWRIVMQPLSRMMPIVTQLALPVFADISDDRTLVHQAYRRASQLTSLLLAPLVLGLMVIFPLINELILGHGWESVTALIQLLSILVLVRVFTPLTGSIMLAMKDFNWPLRWQLVFLVVTTPSILLMSQFSESVAALAFSMVVAQSIITIYMYVRFLKRLEVPNPRENVQDIVSPIMVSLLMAVALFFARPEFELRLPDLLAAAAMIALGAAIYGIGAVFLLKQHVRIFVDVILRR